MSRQTTPSHSTFSRQSSPNTSPIAPSRQITPMAPPAQGPQGTQALPTCMESPNLQLSPRGAVIALGTPQTTFQRTTSPSEWSQASPTPSVMEQTWPLVKSGYEKLTRAEGESFRSDSTSSGDSSPRFPRLDKGHIGIGVAGMSLVTIVCTLLVAQPFRQQAAAGSVLGGLFSDNLGTNSPHRLVSELYTFGAPGSSLSGLYDAGTQNGCIPGLRVFSRTERQGAQGSKAVADPVSWITAMFKFSHPKMEALEASDQNVRDNPVHACSTNRSDPQSDDFWWMSGHLVYETVLKAHVDFLGGGLEQALDGRRLRASSQGAEGDQDPLHQRLNKAQIMAHFSFMVYTPEISKLVVDAADWGWNLIGHATTLRQRTTTTILKTARRDQVTLYQHKEGLQCILVFEGTNRDDQSDLLSDIDIKAEDFCGFGLVHAGFKSKLMTMLKSEDFKQVIKPKLPHCSTVVVGGHSLGGAQAELFTACANRHMHRGEEGYEDHQVVSFEKKAPQRLPKFEVQQTSGKYLRNIDTGLCLDVSGTVNTHTHAELRLWECEFPSSNFSKDQRWRLTPQGFLVSGYSGQCADLSGANPELGGSELRQWPCEFDIKDSVQRWVHTPEGFLKHVTTGQCIDSKLATYPCPHTDQQWQMLSDGHILNVLSGLCMGVRGLPGTKEGADIILWDCQYNDETNQRWDLLPSGSIRNRLSQECITWETGQKMRLRTANCNLGNLLTVKISDKGFMQSQENGKCVDADGQPGTKPGTAVALANCEDKHIETGGIWTLSSDGFVRNVGNDWNQQNKCLQIYGRPETDDKLVEGAAIHMDMCEIGTDQTWQVSDDGYIKNSIGGQKCASTYDDSNEMWLQNCETLPPTRGKWRFVEHGGVQNLDTNQCITVQDGEEGGLGFGGCDGAQAQGWLLRPDGALVSNTGSGCLSLQHGAAEDSLAVQSCPTSGALPDHQKWRFSAEGYLHSSVEDLCLFQGPSGLVAKACPTNFQQWQLAPDGSLRDLHSGKCATAALEPARMPRLQLDKCGVGLQRWEVISG